MLQYPLLGPRDRESMGCRSIGRGLALIFLGITSIVFGIFHSRTAKAQQALVERGTAATGKISQAWMEGRSTLKVTYSFPAKDTTVWIEGRRVSSDLAPRTGDSIAVWYDPGDPKKCVSELERSEGGPSAALGAGLGVGALFLLLGCVSIGLSMKRGGALLST